MTSQGQVSFDPRIADWLESDPNHAPDQVLEIVLAAFPSVDQRRGSRLPRRISTMPTNFRLAFGAAAVIAVVLGGALLLRPGAAPGGVGGPPSSPVTLPTATPSPTATPMPFPTALSRSGIPIDPGSYALDLPTRNSTTGAAAPLRITFTMPASWRKYLTPTTMWHASELRRLGFLTVENLYADPCGTGSTGLLDPPLGPTVDDLITGLQGLPGLTMTTPTDISVAGYSGRQIELSAPAEFPSCVSTYRAVWSGPEGAVTEDGGDAIAANETTRYLVLDVAGVRLVISRTFHDGASAEALAEMQAIVDSVRIERIVAAPSASPAP